MDTNGTPYVAYLDRSDIGQVTVMKYTGSGDTGRELVGSPRFSDGEVYYISLAIDSHETPYIAYQDVANNYEAVIMKYDDSDRVSVGNTGFSNGEARNISLTIYNDIPYMIYNATAIKYDSGTNSWETL